MPFDPYVQERVHGEANIDADVVGDFILYDVEQSVRTLLATERLVIEDCQIICSASGDCAIMLTEDDTPDAGECVVRGEVAANGGIAMNFQRGYVCKQGVLPRAFGASGNIDAVINGYILTASKS